MQFLANLIFKKGCANRRHFQQSTCLQDVSDGSSKGGAAPAEMETEPSVGAVGGICRKRFIVSPSPKTHIVETECLTQRWRKSFFHWILLVTGAS